MVTALRRLSKRSKSVSELHLSLIDRPRSSEGRFQNNVHLQALVDLGRAPFSKVQAVGKFAFEQKRRSHYLLVATKPMPIVASVAANRIFAPGRSSLSKTKAAK